jgi:threonine synthase
MRLLAETEGIFAEAAGGVVIAALKKLAYSGAIKKNELTVAFITGAGPKTQDILSDIARTATIQPTLESFEEVFDVRA